MAGLSARHSGPLLAIGVFGADICKTILYGLIVALPTAIIAGPIFGTFIAKYIPVIRPRNWWTNWPASRRTKTRRAQHRPDHRCCRCSDAAQNLRRHRLCRRVGAQLDGHMIGHPDHRLVKRGVAASLYTFTHARHPLQADPLLLDASLVPTAAIILIIGAGGVMMLVTSGVGDGIGHMAVNAQINPILLAWLVAAVI